MTTTKAPICTGCKFFDADAVETVVCSAFPDGIPVPILLSEVDHRRPYPGDNGIQFVARRPSDAKYAADLFNGVAIGG